MARRRSMQATLPAVHPQESILRAVQQRVGAWVEDGYPGASELTRGLLAHWFGEPHLRADGSFFQWYPHQKRAVETAVWLYEVSGLRRTEEYGALADLPRTPQRDPWTKVGLQLATGAGKTKVMSLLSTWAHLHWVHDTDLGFGNTQLLIAPNLIVLDRLLTDFARGAIFEHDPLVPPDYRRDWSLRVVTPEGVPGEWRPGEGYLIVTNIHKLYPPEEDGTDEGMPPQLGLFTAPPPTRLDPGVAPLLGFVQSATTPLTVFNDEAHHVHDERTHYPMGARNLDADEQEGIAWHRVLRDIHGRGGLAVQVDLSATLYEEASKEPFRHAVYDYPLTQAITDGVVKQPVLGKVRLQYKDSHDEPIPLVDDAATHAWDRYTQLIQAGIAQWKREQQSLDERGLGRKAILFIVCRDQKDAAQISARLEEFRDPETDEALFAGRVKEIHIGRKEGQNERVWQKIKDEVNKVDAPDNPFTAVVSVIMLKEGWDVRNVKVIVPLRTCDSRQLTEQLLGRGLRLMYPPYWTPEGELKRSGHGERLYVIRHPSFERILRGIQDIIREEDEGEQPPDPSRMVVSPVEPEEVRRSRDLPIVQIVGAFDTGDDWVERVNRARMPALGERHPWVTDLKEIEGIIRHEGALGPPGVTDEVIRYDVRTADYASIDAVIAAYAEAIRNEQRITRYYEAAVKGIVKAFLERCTFDLRGIPLSLDMAEEAEEETKRIALANIQRPKVKTDVIQSVGRIIGLARSGEENPEIQTETRWARDLGAFEAVPRNILHHPAKCVFDACCFDSADEVYLAQLFDEADDVAAWLWNDQSGVQFRIQYAFEGKTPWYYPDFLVRMTDGSMVIVESKGSIRDRDRAKQTRTERYVDLLRLATGQSWSYLFLINDRAIGREDVGWWRKQGRTLLRDLIRHVENAPAPGASVTPLQQRW
ncbi:MAG: DEAD/DEAH box helicase family protein [Chloroflexota bacterium]|nr:DEAD/DEAH box helicase family protein [Chloroflexota bacterium]